MDVFIEAERLLADCVSNDTEDVSKQKEKGNQSDNGEAHKSVTVLVIVAIYRRY